jgi:hypothetical protein
VEWTGHGISLWSSEDDPKELRGESRYLLARSGGKSILTNRKVSHGRE